MSALVIEDDSVTGAAMCKMLRDNGWRAEWACDLVNAEAKLANYDPDLIVVDLRLPGDPDVLAWLRAWGRDRRIIFFTAKTHADTDPIQAAFPSADVIHKPASREEIIRVIGMGRKGVRECPQQP